MCGIVGYIGKKKCDPKDLKILMLANMWRGVDASGYFTPEGGIIKSCERIDNFLSTNDIVATKLFIGHVRKSTYSATDKKSHPFHNGNIIGVHNGTLTNHYYLKTNIFKDTIELETSYIDSEFLIAALNTGNEVLSIYEGAVASIWYNTKEDKTIHFYHDSERPLFRGNKNDGLFISSTEESLKIIGCENIKAVNEHVVYTATQDAGIIAERCRTIKRTPLKPVYSNVTPPSRGLTPIKNNAAFNLLDKLLQEKFNMEDYVKHFNNWAIFDPAKCALQNIVEPKEFMGDYVATICKLPDTEYMIVFSPSLMTCEFASLASLEDVPMEIGTICYLMNSDKWEAEDMYIAIIDDIVESSEGRIYVVKRFKIFRHIDDFNTIDLYEPRRLELLGTQLLPVIDAGENKIFETAINDYEAFDTAVSG